MSAPAFNSTQSFVAESPRSMQTRKLWRQRWILIHRWIGFAAGAFLVVAGLTGSLYVFYQEIAESLVPDLFLVQASPGGRAAYRPWREIIEAGDSHKPAGTVLSGLIGPRNDRAAARLSYAETGDSSHGHSSYELCVNPYTGELLGRSTLDEHPVWRVCSFLFELHYALKLGEFGGIVVGSVAIVGLISVLSGLYLWWPRWSALRHALTIKRNAGPVRVNHDLHRATGFYSSIVLGAVLLSGVWMNFNPQFIWAVKLFSPQTRAGDADVPRSSVTSNHPALPLAAFLDDFCRESSGARLNWVSLPDQTDGVVTVSFVEVPGSTVSHWSERTLYIDAATGKALRVDDPATRRTAGETFLAWQWPLHSGKAFGWPGRLAVFAAGFVPLVLYITGIRIWLRKRRAARARLKPYPATSLVL